MTRVLILGAGEMATGVAWTLARAGLHVELTEIARPLAVRRLVSFAQAVYDGETTVEGTRATVGGGTLPVWIDPQAARVSAGWDVVVDGRMAKRNLGLTMSAAPLVIALGPGFEGGLDAHVVIETHRGPNLGRPVTRAQPDTGEPTPVEGVGGQRVLRAPCGGVFDGGLRLGTVVPAGTPLGRVGGRIIHAPIHGLLRGLIHDGVEVAAGDKVGDVYPRTDIDPRRISDKARTIGSAVLEVVLDS